MKGRSDGERNVFQRCFETKRKTVVRKCLENTVSNSFGGNEGISCFGIVWIHGRKGYIFLSVREEK
jgi:hypothetical protein